MRRVGRAPSDWAAVGATWFPGFSEPVVAVRSRGLVSTSWTTCDRTSGRQESIVRHTPSLASSAASSHVRPRTSQGATALAHIVAPPGGARPGSTAVGKATSVPGDDGTRPSAIAL